MNNHDTQVARPPSCERVFEFSVVIMGPAACRNIKVDGSKHAPVSISDCAGHLLNDGGCKLISIKPMPVSIWK